MTDIVEWLLWNAKEQGSRFAEAANEIERLRKALKEVSVYVARAEWFYMTEETNSIVKQLFREEE